jgi:hypothetical protein
MGYKFNEKYFDAIDNEHKAYWLGFLWADGYVGMRDRPNRQLEYNIKLDLQESDKSHIEKFKFDLESDHPIHNYGYITSYSNSEKSFIYRLFITNVHMGKLLREKYGIVPDRNDCSEVLKFIPEIFYKHFIRGIFDGDGSFSYYKNIDKKGRSTNKAGVSFTTYESVLEFIEFHFYKNNIASNEYHKKYKRHNEEGKDGYCRDLKFSGIDQVTNVLNYLYNNATIYLDRKYDHYLDFLKNGRNRD